MMDRPAEKFSEFTLSIIPRLMRGNAGKETRLLGGKPGRTTEAVAGDI
jgi:hypothetical protein